jgi:hypothetical protein
MRKLKNLVEVVGVPNNIFESSVKIYKEILNEIKKESGEEEEKEFNIDFGFEIADTDFDGFNLKVKFVEYDGDEYQWIRMAVSNLSELTQDFRFKHNISRIVDLILDIAVPNDWEYQKFVDLFIKNRDKMIESISHELMHVYHNIKVGSEDTRKAAEYVTAGKVKTGIGPIDKFSFYLYYTSGLENVVRPTEVASYLKLNSATKKRFFEFLKKNDTYQKLVEIREFSYEKMIQDLLGMVDQIEEFFEEVGVNSDDYSDLDDNGKVDIFLKIYYNSLLHTKANTLQEMLTTNFIEMIQGFVGEKDTFFRKFLSKMSRFDSYESFFRYQEKVFKIVADKMIRKIAKLYSILDDEKINESIIGWDLYHKIHKTQEKYMNDLKSRIKNIL